MVAMTKSAIITITTIIMRKTENLILIGGCLQAASFFRESISKTDLLPAGLCHNQP